MTNITGISQQNNNYTIDGSVRPEAQAGEKSVELKLGTAIKGTVVSITDTEAGKIATINVGDSTISAKLTDGMGLREGQTLNFVVRSQGQNTSTITPLFENTSADQSTLKALMAAGIEINNDTIRMVKEMMETNQSINKDSLLQMNKNLTAFPNASISTMVEMKSLNIPITESNIEQFSSYKNYEHQVINEMQNIMDELPAAFNELVNSGNSKDALTLYGNLLKMFSEGTVQENPEQAVVAQEGAEAAGQTAQTAQDGQVAQNENALKEASAQIKDASIPKEANETQNKMELSNDFIRNLKNLGVSDKTVNDMVNAAKTGDLKEAQAQLLKELSSSFESAELGNDAVSASWKKLFSSDEYNKILKNTISEQWLIKPDDVQKKENIDNLYQRLGYQAKALAETINNSALEGSKLGQSVTNLNNNLDFMNQLNNMFQYIQLPLQMTGQNVHGDLYVYQNKHKKMSEDGSVSAILHLDMENLGPLDVYVKMIDTKVTTNFYVADESVIELINDNIHILDERLQKRGYSMTVNLKLQDDIDGNDGAVDEMLNVSRMPVISTASFDARA